MPTTHDDSWSIAHFCAEPIGLRRRCFRRPECRSLRDRTRRANVPFGIPLKDLGSAQTFTLQDTGLLSVRGRLVLGDHPCSVLGGERPPHPEAGPDSPPPHRWPWRPRICWSLACLPSRPSASTGPCSCLTQSLAGGGTRTSHHRRSMPVPGFVVEALSLQCVGKGPEDLACQAPMADTSGNPTAPAARSIRPGGWRMCPDLAPHDLRHTAVLLAMSAEANDKAVQKMLGHASVAMTPDFYRGPIRRRPRSRCGGNGSGDIGAGCTRVCPRTGQGGQNEFASGRRRGAEGSRTLTGTDLNRVPLPIGLRPQSRAANRPAPPHCIGGARRPVHLSASDVRRPGRASRAPGRHGRWP